MVRLQIVLDLAMTTRRPQEQVVHGSPTPLANPLALETASPIALETVILMARPTIKSPRVLI